MKLSSQQFRSKLRRRLEVVPDEPEHPEWTQVFFFVETSAKPVWLAITTEVQAAEDYLQDLLLKLERRSRLLWRYLAYRIQVRATVSVIRRMARNDAWRSEGKKRPLPDYDSDNIPAKPIHKLDSGTLSLRVEEFLQTQSPWDQHVFRQRMHGVTYRDLVRLPGAPKDRKTIAASFELCVRRFLTFYDENYND